MSDLYFGPDVDQAIVLFQLEEDKDAKNEVFVKEIKPAFEKLISYHYFRTPVARNPEVLHDCLTFLYEQLEKFDAEKHKRGFPYFNVIARNYFNGKIKSEKKQISYDQNATDIADLQQKSTYTDFLIVESPEEDIEKDQFFEILKENLPKWRDQFQKKQERMFVDALISILENVDNIDIYNKKAIFFYLKEITDLNSKQIGSNLAKIKKKYVGLKKKYNRGEF